MTSLTTCHNATRHPPDEPESFRSWDHGRRYSGIDADRNGRVELTLSLTLALLRAVRRQTGKPEESGIAIENLISPGVDVPTRRGSSTNPSRPR